MGRSLPRSRPEPGAPTPDPGEDGRRLEVARRRAEAAGAGLAGDDAAARAFLEDPEPAVRAAALGALCRLGACTPAEAEAALADESALVRRSACELGAHLPPTDGVRALLDDTDPAVVEAACFALGELGDAGAVGTLGRLAGGHPDPLCREAAVAALGAIGDPEGLPAVLGALDDVPAVRRRAVVALAAFDGPEVEEALRGRLEDRDWQVRQAAEALLHP